MPYKFEEIPQSRDPADRSYGLSDRAETSVHLAA